MTHKLGQDVGIQEGGALAQLAASDAPPDIAMIAELSSPYHSFVETDDDIRPPGGHALSPVVLDNLARLDHSSPLVTPDDLSSANHLSGNLS